MRDTTQPTSWERGRRDVERETKKAMTPGQTLTPEGTAVTAQNACAAAATTTTVRRGDRSARSTTMSTAQSSAATTITHREAEQVERANAAGLTPVVFVHGLWLLPSSWDRWAAMFEEAGYIPLTPEWPDDPETVEEANAHPEVFAGKTVGQVADHYAEVIRSLERRPAVIGHSFGGLLAQMLAGRGLSAATVAIDAASFRGVLA